MFKKILIYGESWEGALPQLLFAELCKHGYKVDIFDFTYILPGIRNRSIFQRFNRRLFSNFYAAQIRSRFLRKIEEFLPDLVLVSKGVHLNIETLTKIRSLGIILVNWNPDDFFNMKNSTSSLIDSMRLYDLLISPREHLFQKYKDHGVRKLLYLDWYYVPEMHFDRRLSKTIPASFVGSWSPSRENFIGSMKIKFNIWGGGWKKSSREFNKIHNVHKKVLSQVEMSSVFCKSKFNLNLLTHENSDCSNLRLFEVPASGGLLLTERNSAAVKRLLDRHECLMFSSANELNQLFYENFDFDLISRLGNQRITSGGNAFSNRVNDLVSFFKCHF